MLNVTVKTLDARDQKFTVEESLTVSDFKKLIENNVQIPSHRQRLIFRGRVLQDDKNLVDLGVDGNVLHLVDRPPPESFTQSSVSGDDGPHPHPHRGQRHVLRNAGQNIFMGSFPLPLNNMTSEEIEATVRRVLDRLGEIGRSARISLSESPNRNSVDLRIALRAPRPAFTDSPARARLEHIYTVLRQVNHILYHLERDDSDAANDQERENGESDDVDTYQSVVPSSCDDESHEGSTGRISQENDQSLPDSHPGESTEAGSQHDNVARVRHANVPELADAMAEVLRIQERIRPHVNRYQELLRNEKDFSNNVAAGRRTSRFFNGMQVLMHNMGHVYHTISDLNVHFCEPVPRRLYPQLIGEEIAEPPEAQITLNFSSASNDTPAANRNQAAADVAGTGNRHNGRQNLTIPFGQNNENGSSRGVMHMEVGPEGIAIRATAVTTTAGNGPTSTNTTITTAPVQTSEERGAEVGPEDSNSQNPMEAFGSNLFQQIMQGIGMVSDGTGREPTAQSRQLPRARMPFPVQFPAAAVAGQMPRPGFAGFGSGISGGRNGAGVRLSVGQQGESYRSRLPAGIQGLRQQRHRQDDTGGPAIFVGPRPPSELPLYTIDPFLPCPSRHFDPAHALRRHRRDTPSQATNHQLQQENSGQTAAQPVGENAGVRSDNEFFEAALTQMLRSVIVNLSHDVPGRANTAGSEMYNFHPIMGGGGMVAAVPIQVDLPEPPTETSQTTERTRAEEVEAEETVASSNAEPERGNRESQSSSEENGEAEIGPMQSILTGMFRRMNNGNVDITLAEFLRGIGEEMVSGRGFVGELYKIMAEVLPFQDLVAVFSGNSSPLNRARSRIRRYMIDNILNGNDRPSEDDFRSVARRLPDPDIMDELAQDIQPRESNLDIGASLNRCEQVAVEDSLRLIFDSEDSADFGRRLFGRLRLFIRELLYLGCYACADGITGAELMVQRYLDTMTSHVGPSMAEWTHRVSREYLQNIFASGEVNDEMVQRFLVYRRSQDSESSTDEIESEKEDKNIEDDIKEKAAEQDANGVFVESESPMETDVASNENCEKEPCDEIAIGWKRALPPDWVKVIERDVEKQKIQLTQQPFSDAYLAGMPPKRRKMMLDKRGKVVSGTTDDSFRDTLRKAVQEVGAKPITGEQTEDVTDNSHMSSALSTAFREKVKEGLEQRFRKEANFADAQRFPSSNQYFRP